MSVKICKTCLMLSTRPRLTFDANGVCSACQWAKEKRTTVNWDARKQELKTLCSKYRDRREGFDVIVPVSGGKDSSTVAHRLKNEFGMNPLCINISHSIQCNTELNDINLNNFIVHGFDCLRIYPNATVLRTLDKVGLVEYGQPYFGWMTAMVLAPLRVGTLFDIPFIMYGEDGEVEYGGSTELKNTPYYNTETIIRLYLSGVDPSTYLKMFSKKQLFWWMTPSHEDVQKLSPALAHWSYFENWDSNFNYKYAHTHVGLKKAAQPSVGTYTDFAQTDSILYPLHTYFMYLKFGFGHCTQDVCIDLRSGRLTRKEGIELILQYDEAYPAEFEEQYLKYYSMTKDEFEAVIDKFANKELLEKKNGRWVKKFTIH